MIRTISRSAVPWGRIHVADRLNSRIQVFDQDGNFITAWHQFGQPSSVFVGPDDRIYVGVAFRNEATRRNPTSRAQPGELRGIMVGSAMGGCLLSYLIRATSVLWEQAQRRPVLRRMRWAMSMPPMSAPIK
jgi:hypothetical protein